MHAVPCYAVIFRVARRSSVSRAARPISESGPSCVLYEMWQVGSVGLPSATLAAFNWKDDRRFQYETRLECGGAAARYWAWIDLS